MWCVDMYGYMLKEMIKILLKMIMEYDDVGGGLKLFSSLK